MAGVYTTKRGKNKKAKLGQRKDAANNAANKLQGKVKESALESLFDQPEERKVLSLGSSEQRRKTALLRAQERLQLTAAGSGTEEAGVEKAMGGLSVEEEAPPPSLATCQSIKCVGKSGDEEKVGKTGAGAKLLLCGGCRLVSYCCAACQKEDWAVHKVACKHTQALLKQAREEAAKGYGRLHRRRDVQPSGRFRRQHCRRAGKLFRSQCCADRGGCSVRATVGCWSPRLCTRRHWRYIRYQMSPLQPRDARGALY